MAIRSEIGNKGGDFGSGEYRRVALSMKDAVRFDS
jgi:hypothetical protein